jgi:Astacin (Peptidase family M12A)
MAGRKKALPQREVPVEVADDYGKQNGGSGRFQCALRERPARVMAPGVSGARLEAINLLSNKWANGTLLRYYFFDRQTDGENVMFTDGNTEWRTWVGAAAQQDVVRSGFGVWNEVGIGMKFQEVNEREEAEIRIGFMRGDGAWSWLGREILDKGPNERTMNFGWDLTRPGEIDTAVHEIGHTLGFPHEHQNPKAGIEWDEEAVYASLAEPPNSWDRSTTFWNIIRKLPAGEVQGTVWDPDSIMHYPFEAGLIKRPKPFDQGLTPRGGLSAKDKAWVKTLYPPDPDSAMDELKPGRSILLEISAGEQRSFTIRPQETREYSFQTFGTSDSVLVLFEKTDQQLRFRKGADDSGEDTNASMRIKLIKDSEYVLRLRLYHTDRPAETSVMMW